MLPGSCVDSQYYQIYQFNRWPAGSSAGISGVSKWVHLAKRVSEGGCSLGKKTQSTIRKTGMWMMQAVGGLLVTSHGRGHLWISTLKETSGTITKMNEASGCQSTVSLQWGQIQLSLGGDRKEFNKEGKELDLMSLMPQMASKKPPVKTSHLIIQSWAQCPPQKDLA